jgi:hypothetical protein
MKNMTLIKCAALAVSLAVLGTGWLTAAETNTNAPGKLSPLAKARSIKVDSCYWDGLPLSEVIRNLNDQAILRDPEHQGVKISLAATAQAKENTPITLHLNDTNLAEILDRAARQADLGLMEKDGGVVFVLKKKQP